MDKASFCELQTLKSLCEPPASSGSLLPLCSKLQFSAVTGARSPWRSLAGLKSLQELSPACAGVVLLTANEYQEELVLLCSQKSCSAAGLREPAASCRSQAGRALGKSSYRPSTWMGREEEGKSSGDG